MKSLVGRSVSVEHKWNLTQAKESVSDVFHQLLPLLVPNISRYCHCHFATQCVRLCRKAQIPVCFTVVTGSCR